MRGPIIIPGMHSKLAALCQTMLALIVFVLASSFGSLEDPCTGLQQQINKTYGFRPSRLTEEQKTAKSALMDEFWKRVKAAPKELGPCLKTALEMPNADGWFKIDGSGLLVEIDPSHDSKELKARLWCAGDLDDVDLRLWMQTLASLGNEGFDVSEAGRRWLAEKDPSFAVPEHAMQVARRGGAVFLFGSMDEALATPALEKLASDPKVPHRDLALDLLSRQATPDALRALKRIDLSTYPKKTRDGVTPLLGRPPLVTKRSGSGNVTRASLLAAFKAYLAGDGKPLDKTMELAQGKSNEHWPGQVSGSLLDEDVPLLRQVRRKRATVFSDEALEDYETYTHILMTLVWKPEYVK